MPCRIKDDVIIATSLLVLFSIVHLQFICICYLHDECFALVSNSFYNICVRVLGRTVFGYPIYFTRRELDFLPLPWFTMQMKLLFFCFWNLRDYWTVEVSRSKTFFKDRKLDVVYSDGISPRDIRIILRRCFHENHVVRIGPNTFRGILERWLLFIFFFFFEIQFIVKTKVWILKY